MPIDYSKWKNIEISDDEDDTHPNIDTPSLFRWRHQARVERQDEFDKKKAELKEAAEKKEKELKEIKQKAASCSKDGSADMQSLQSSIKEVEKEAQEAVKKLQEVAHEEQLRPWNVDTISHEGFSKSAINKPLPRQDKELTDEEKDQKMKKFVRENEDDLKKFGWLSKFDDSKAFMLEKPNLACEEAANYLVIRCLNLAMEEKFSAMEQVAHQCICIQYLLELAKQLEVDPRSCISSFFSKIKIADEQYKKAFEDELEAFKQRIRTRAKQKIEEQLEEARKEAEAEAEELNPEDVPLGPGGLNPIEVMNSLPESLQKCFESQDIEMLQRVIRELPPEEARHHMKRCVASGLWKPAEDENTDPDDGFVRRKEDSDADEGKDEDRRKEGVD